MTIVIDLTPDQEARLHEKAAQQGKGVAEFARGIVLREAEPDEWLRLIQSIGIETGVSLSDEAVSRESLYEDHL